MKIPFDGEKLNALMEAAGADLLLATSKDNVQYLLGGYRYFYFAHKDAIGVSRYLPLLGYPRGAPEKAFYIGNGMERWHQEVEPLWTPEIANVQWSCDQAGREAAGFIRKRGLAKGRVAVEKSFLPADALDALREELPGAQFIEAGPILDALRAVKRPEELALLKEASEDIIGSMMTVMTATAPGTTTREIAHRMHHEEVGRGLDFEYCLTAAGPSFNRAPSEARWEKGRALSLDSGGNKRGYIGDLARMAVMGPPTDLMKEVLGEIRAVQAAARSVLRAGALGREVYAAALAEQEKCPHKGEMVFLAHGMGMIQHEAPHLTGSGIVPYPGTYENRALESGMVLSVETDMRNEEVGFVKLEDTIVVQDEGWEAYGDEGRDWVVAEG